LLVLTKLAFEQIVVKTVKQRDPVNELFAAALLELFKAKTDGAEPLATEIHNDLKCFGGLSINWYFCSFGAHLAFYFLLKSVLTASFFLI